MKTSKKNKNEFTMNTREKEEFPKQSNEDRQKVNV